MKTLLLSFITIFAMQAMAQTPDITTLTSSNLPGILEESKIEEIMCGQNSTIKDHMARMGFIIRSLRELVNDIVIGNNADEVRGIVMIDSQVLRTHLTAVLPKTPEKIKNIDPSNIQKNKIIFQRYIHRMIGYTIDIEEELLKKPLTPDGLEAQRLKIAGLIIKIDETVTEAHNLFRF